MKKTKNISWLISIFILAICSCSNDSDNDVKLLQKVIETSKEGVSKTTFFTYNGDKIVSVNGGQKHTNYTYTDHLITKTVTLNKTNQLLETIEYRYVENKLVEVKSLDNYRIHYIHNSDKTVSYERFTIGLGNQEVKEYHGVLYSDNENFSKDERTLDNTAAGVLLKHSISFYYDSKNNPLYTILGYKRLLDRMEAISSNNSLINTVIATTTNGDQVLSSANFYKSSFKYDSDNYPTEQISENENTGYLKTEYFY